MAILFEILPLMCGIFVGFLLHLSAWNRTNRYAFLGISSLCFGVLINQISSEPLAFVALDAFYVALSAVATGFFAKQFANFKA